MNIDQPANDHRDASDFFVHHRPPTERGSLRDGAAADRVVCAVLAMSRAFLPWDANLDVAIAPGDAPDRAVGRKPGLIRSRIVELLNLAQLEPRLRVQVPKLIAVEGIELLAGIQLRAAAAGRPFGGPHPIYLALFQFKPIHPILTLFNPINTACISSNPMIPFSGQSAGLTHKDSHGRPVALS